MAKAELTDTRVQGPHQPVGGGDELLTLQQVAEFLDVSPNTVYYWRYQGTGPRGHRVGRRVRYWRSEVVQWLEDRSDPVAGLPALRRR